MDKQVHKTIFAGRRIQVNFNFPESSLEQKLEKLTLLDEKRIYKIGPETTFTTMDKSNGSNSEIRCIDEKFFSCILIDKSNLREYILFYFLI